MAIFLDNEAIDTAELGPDSSIGQLLDVVKSRVGGSGRLVLGLRCNEEEVDAEQLSDMLAAPIADFERLEFFSGRPEETVLEALKATRRAFEDTFPTVQEATEAVTGGDLPRTMSLLADCFTVWGQTHEAVLSGGRLLDMDFSSLIVADRPIIAWVTELASKLRELKDAIESRDHVLLGDILRYELDGTLRNWEHMLGGFIEHVERMCGDAAASGV
jgi:hypothetical protein